MTRMVTKQLKYDDTILQSYPRVYSSERSPSPSSLNGIPGAGLVTQGAVQGVQFVCVCVLACVQCRVEGVQSTLCMWGAEGIEMYKLFLIVVHFHFLPHCFILPSSHSPSVDCRDEQTSHPKIQSPPPRNQHLPSTSSRVIL